MRTGLIISTATHALLLLGGMVSFAAKPLEAPAIDSVPVELISSTDFTKMMAGSKTAPQAEAPKPLVEKVGERKPAEDPNLKVADKKPEIVAALQQEQPPPLPEPKKEKAEKKEPEKADKPDPVLEALKKEQAKKEKEKKELEKKEQAKKEKEKHKEAHHKPAPKKPEKPKFDASKVQALLDKRTPQRMAAAGEVLNSRPTLGTTTGSAMTLSQSEIDALRAQIQQCWSPPAGVAEARDLVVKIRLLLNQDGSLSAEPALLNRGSHPVFQIAAESAMRAIKRCQPYKLPIAKYEVWRDVEVTFDPRDMFRG